ncbi:LLM class flavin-dependent oxidoreductase [Candidatus Bathyarchaeota archaeon]|nr:LLM class flavin-dependent oxidoreductase [Candidatus Bathyarchaeota archaeon]
MKFFISGLGNFYRSWKLVEKVVPAADDLGYYGVVLPDHYMWDWSQMPDRNSTLDAWTAFSYLAVKTHNIKLATLVTPIPFRPPSMLAKMIATLDVISSGRTILGVGAGWSKTEFDGYSEWNDAKTRVDKTEEGVQLIRRLWTEETVDFQGRFYKAKGAVLDPKPAQKPYPPLMFGGVSPRMLGMAGKYGDLCFIPPWTKMSFTDAKRMVERAYRRANRSTSLMFGAGSPTIPGGKFDMNTLSKDVQTAIDNGCEFYVVAFSPDDYVPMMRQFQREIVPSFESQTRLST